jgi:hypothetical protein
MRGAVSLRAVLIVRRLLLAASIPAFALALGAGYACSSTEGPPPAGTSDAGAERTQDGDAATPQSDAPTCPGATTRPSDVPEGWELHRDYDPCCGFYAPVDRAHLPAPIRWEPCSPSDNPPGYSCRLMITDWQPGEGIHVRPGIAAFNDPSDGVSIMLTRLVGKYHYVIAARADGPVLQSLLETRPTTCTLSHNEIAVGRYAHGVYQDGRVKAALAGSLTDFVPRTFVRDDNSSETHGYVATAAGLVDLTGGAVQLFDWDGGGPRQLRAVPQDDGLAQHSILSVGRDIFWSAETTRYNKIKVFTERDGTRDFLSFGADTTRGVSAFGADSTDMAWVQGSERTSGAEFPKLEMMAARYTSDPAAITARRVRSLPAPARLDAYGFVVGCGYAARPVTVNRDAAVGMDLMLVRLSDGRTWMLPGDGPMRWYRPLAITCSEIFAWVGRAGVIARLRLDSIGPGAPPD